MADITCVRTMGGWVVRLPSPADVYSRRIIGWQTSTSLHTDLALDALRTAIWQRQREGADLTGLIHHLRPRGAVPRHPLRPGPERGRRRGLRRPQRGDSYAGALAEALNPLYKAELIRNRAYLDAHGPWQGLDDARDRHRRVGPLVQHHPPPPRHHRHVAPPSGHENAWQPDADVPNTDTQTTNHPQPATADAR